jgi:hypothetical protein
MSGQMERLVRVRPRKKIIQISHTCRAGVSEARNQRAPHMLRTGDQSNNWARTESADLKLRILTN